MRSYSCWLPPTSFPCPCLHPLLSPPALMLSSSPSPPRFSYAVHHCPSFPLECHICLPCSSPACRITWPSPASLFPDISHRTFNCVNSKLPAESLVGEPSSPVQAAFSGSAVPIPPMGNGQRMRSCEVRSHESLQNGKGSTRQDTHLNLTKPNGKYAKKNCSQTWALFIFL